MATVSHPPLISNPVPEQQLLIPVLMTWEQFKTLESWFEGRYSIRLSYLDGSVNIMTLSPEHEIIKSLLGLLLSVYFVEKDISFTPTGSATLQAEKKGSSKEPDLSYRFGENRRQRQAPDLAIEVVITSGNITKLEYYARFGVTEVWFWQDGVFSLYRLTGADYKSISRSEILPDLDLTLLAHCLQMSEEKEALKFFRQTLHSQ